MRLSALLVGLLVAAPTCQSQKGGQPAGETAAPGSAQPVAAVAAEQQRGQPPQHAAGQDTSARALRIEGANGFKSHEIFRTSTANAPTGYDAYISWNADTLAFGYTGQDVGASACPPDAAGGCPVYAQGEAASKYLYYYFDTDPQGGQGTTRAQPLGGQSWTLPFRADYFVRIRTDYDSSQVAGLYAWNGMVWSDQGPAALTIADNDGSKFLEFAVARAALGQPAFLRVASWFADEASGRSYAYWPENAADDLPDDGTTTGAVALTHDYGFVLIDGQTPNASNGQANRDRPFVAGYGGGPVNGNNPAGAHPGRSFPFHSLGLTTSNDFSGKEIFATSTQAATGYDAYASWDATNLYFGYTGSDFGPGDCAWPDTPGPVLARDTVTVDTSRTGTRRADSGGRAAARASYASSSDDCQRYETGQAPDKWLVYYLDTDPQAGAQGTDTVSYGGQRWRLPFRADYQILLRTDGVTNDRGYTGVADVRKWSGTGWTSQGPEALEVFINSTSGFAKFSIPRDSLGSPVFLQAASWIVDTAYDTSYAYWPKNAVAEAPASPDAAVALRHAYGFVLVDGQAPNTSNGQANLDRPFVPGLTPAPVNGNTPQGQSGSTAWPFHSIGFTTSNDFTRNEAFRTSTRAATGYAAYASWDATNLYLGVTGSDIGPGDCSDPDGGGTDASPRADSTHARPGDNDCATYETGQSPDKYLVYYLDTDPFPESRQGTAEAEAYGGQQWTLPFRADYALWIRTDGETVENNYTGVADLRRWDGQRWVSQGPVEALEVYDNSTSGFLKLAVARAALGRPDFIKIAGWLVDAAQEKSYAYWPASAPAEAASADGTTTGAVTLQHYYGFVLIDGQRPGTSDGQANLDRPFYPGLEARPVNGNTPEGQSASAPYPFHSVGFTTSNDFTEHEAFATSTQAATGYQAYASWDATNLYFGYTGSDIGPGDCLPAAADSGATALGLASAADDCQPYETGQAPSKHLVYYLDTDPTGSAGTAEAQYHGTQSWTLPFKADYAVILRTDGETVENNYTGVADLWRWDGQKWLSLGPHALEIFDNSTSGFLKLAVPRAALGHPDAIKVVSWFFDTAAAVGYAYWPENAPAEALDEAGMTTGRVALQHYYGFILDDGQLPAASSGQANLDRPFFGTYACASDDFGEGGADYGGAARPFHAITMNGSNGFTKQEIFKTSTDADTGYDAYATWDRRKLYLGYTGSDIGGGDCSDTSIERCQPYETGQSPQKWIVYYLDTDPGGSRGTPTAYSDALYAASDTLGTQQTWQLPFRADYAILVRTDGQTIKEGHTGVVEVKAWNGQNWVSRGPCGVRLWDNNGSGFLELAADLSYFGNPYQLKIVGWVFGPERSYAYWPHDAAADGPARGTRLESAWGFALREGVLPNVSANKNRPFLAPVEDQVTYNTYTLDGETAVHEQLPAENLGRESQGAPAGLSNPELFLSWDAEHLYLSLNGGALVAGRSDLYLALDTDPVSARDPRDGPGLAHQPNDPTANRRHATYPFAADAVYQFYATTHDSLSPDTADAQVQDPAPGQRFRVVGDTAWAGYPVPKGVRIIRQVGKAPTEVAIPWSDIGVDAGGHFHLIAYLVDYGNGLDAQWPPQNPNGSDVTFTHFRSYYRQPGAEPFSNASLSIRETGGTTLSEALYANIYLVPPAAQTTTLGANTTVLNELYVGEKATLDVGTNALTPSGFNKLRIGRRLAARGTIAPGAGTVVTFDPAVGYPQGQQPGGGFAADAAPTEVLCGAAFYTLVLRNQTVLRACPGTDARARFTVADSLHIEAGGALHTNGHRLMRPANADSSTAAIPSPGTETASTRKQAASATEASSGRAAADTASLGQRVRAFFRRHKEQ